MSKWNDPIVWSALLDGSACPICRRAQPLHILATLDISWLTMPEDAPMPGYVCLVSQVHVVELHELNEVQAGAFMRDAQRVSRALAAVTGAVKLNYEIHGNTLPHLHLHFFPRYIGDSFEGKPIDPRAVTHSVYTAQQFSEIRDRLLRELDRHES